MMQTYALGIDVGGTNTAFGLVNRRGEIIEKGTLPTTTWATVQDFVNAIALRLKPLLDRVGCNNIAGVGVGAPNGNFYTGEIAFAPNLPWKGVIPLARLLHEAVHLPCILTNDANAAAIGEMVYGVARGMSDFLVVTLGTGLGSGFVANGKVMYGHDGFAGELGHVIAVRNGRLCGCGRKGCLETYCSATGLVRTAREWLLQRTEETELRAIPPDDLRAHHIQQAAANGDALALEMYDYTARILGETLADVVALTSPQAIVFFGGMAKAGDILLAPTQRYMEANMLNIFANKVAFHISALPDADAAILGASALVW